MHTQAIRK